eukprot:Seg806.2 transcript_id=Seg806.2/GoldUCD/mRNA.D3Y31 product="hypothetical protein" protein_id=Seg806.2/GoldUCD/D3Y31
MPQCASVIKTAASSYNIVVCSGIFIPTSLIPALLIIIAIIKDPFKEIKTQINIFVMASSVASLLSIPVNGMRAWFHILNATGIDAYKERKSVIPALHACHFTWFTIHFVASICILAIVLMQMFDRLSVAKEFNAKYSTVYKVIVSATWMIGATFGSCVQLAGMSLMTQIQTTVQCAVAVTSLICAYFCVHLPLEEDEQADVTKEATTKCNDIEDLRKDGSSPTAIVIEKLPPVEIVEVDENVVQVNIMGIREEEKAIIYKAVLYFCCAVPSGILLLIFHCVDSMTCTQMFWVKDVSSLCLQLFLAVHPIFCIVFSPKMKRAVNHILGIKDSVVYPSGTLN